MPYEAECNGNVGDGWYGDDYHDVVRTCRKDVEECGEDACFCQTGQDYVDNNDNISTNDYDDDDNSAGVYCDSSEEIFAATVFMKWMNWAFFIMFATCFLFAPMLKYCCRKS